MPQQSSLFCSHSCVADTRQEPCPWQCQDMSACHAHAGDGFSPRAEDAVLHGCLPVVIMDDVDPVFASVLEWDSFSVRVPEVGTAGTLEPMH